MSKYDNLFKKPVTTSTSNSNSSIKHNSFIVKQTPAEIEANARANYNYKEEAFPDLIVGNKPSVNTCVAETKKYSDITATVNEVKKIEKSNVPPGWTQFTRTKGNYRFDIVHGEKTKRQLEMEEEDALLDNPAYIYNKMITKLSDNWLRYKNQYDSIHGEGAYDLIYYLEPIYPEDETSSDEVSNYNEYFYDVESE